MKHLKINLNDVIFVKFTDDGFEYLCKHYNRFYKLSTSIPEKTVEFYKEQCDEMGLYKILLWEFMNIFGSEMYMGNTKQYFNMDIIIEQVYITI